MTFIDRERGTGHHRRVIGRRITDACSEHIRINRAVIDLHTETRRDLIPVINELHQAATQVSAGEGGDGGAGCAAQLEEAAGHSRGRVGKTRVVWIGDAEVGRRERDRLAFVDGECCTGHHRSVIARRVTDSRCQDVRVYGAVVDLDAEAWRDFIPVIDELHQATAQVSAGEGGNGSARRGAELEEATAHSTHRIGEVRIVWIGEAEVGTTQGHGLAFVQRERRTGNHRGVIHRRVTDSRRQYVRIYAAVVDLDAEAWRDFIAIIDEPHQATAQVSAGEGGNGSARRGAELEEATAHSTHRIGEVRIVWIGEAEVGTTQGHGLAFVQREHRTAHHRCVVHGRVADGRCQNVRVDDPIIDLDAVARCHFVPVINELH